MIRGLHDTGRRQNLRFRERPADDLHVDGKAFGRTSRRDARYREPVDVEGLAIAECLKEADSLSSYFDLTFPIFNGRCRSDRR